MGNVADAVSSKPTFSHSHTLRGWERASREKRATRQNSWTSFGFFGAGLQRGRNKGNPQASLLGKENSTTSKAIECEQKIATCWFPRSYLRQQVSHIGSCSHTLAISSLLVA